MEASITPISIIASDGAEAQRLLGQLGGFRARLNGTPGLHEVEVDLDSATSSQLVGLFDAIGLWVGGNHAPSCQVRFGERYYTLLAVRNGTKSDPTEFLLERTIQLQTALETRIVIEQAKGRLAERYGCTLEEAFAMLRKGARSSGQKIHVLAETVATSAETPDEIQRAL